MERERNFLFMAYLLRRSGRELDVCYHGCRTIVIPDYNTPTHIRGMIEYEGDLIPVIDPAVFFNGKPTRITNASCILVVEHIHNCRSRLTGVVIEDFEEIVNLAAGSYASGTSTPPSFNMRFVIERSDNSAAHELLSETHMALDLRERRKQDDEDFAAFDRIVSASTRRRVSQSSQPSKEHHQHRTASRMPFGHLYPAHAT